VLALLLLLCFCFVFFFFTIAHTLSSPLCHIIPLRTSYFVVCDCTACFSPHPNFPPPAFSFSSILPISRVSFLHFPSRPPSFPFSLRNCFLLSALFLRYDHLSWSASRTFLFSTYTPFVACPVFMSLVHAPQRTLPAHDIKSTPRKFNLPQSFQQRLHRPEIATAARVFRKSSIRGKPLFPILPRSRPTDVRLLGGPPLKLGV